MREMQQKVLRFVTSPVKAPLCKEKSTYQAWPQGAGTKDIKETAQDLVKLGCNVDRTTIAYVLQFFADNLPWLIATDGSRRSLGELVNFFPVITGTLKSPETALDPARNRVEIHAAISRTVRHALDGVQTCNVTSFDIHPRILAVFDLQTDTSIIIPGHALRIEGYDILLVPGRADEGLWLEGGGRAEPLALEFYNSQLETIDFKIPEGVEPGKYRLVLKTRAGRPANQDIFTLTHPLEVSKK